MVVIGISGNRSFVPVELRRFVRDLRNNSTVYVGDGNGVDKYVRENIKGCRVFEVEPPKTPGMFAARSIRFVDALREDEGCLVSFPKVECPNKGLIPSPNSSACFNGSGSGSWATLAYAIGVGVPCVVFLGRVHNPWVELEPTNTPGWYKYEPKHRQLSLF